MIVPIEQEKVKKILAERGVVVIVGMYGTGKGLIVEWLVGELEERGERVVRISLKDLPSPSEGDIPGICGYKSWSLLHASWRRTAENAGRRGRKLTIVVEEAQKLVEGGGRLWEILTSLRYYQKDFVQIVLTGQPLILESENILLRRLMTGNIIFPRRIKREEAGAVWRIARGHWGTVKYVRQLIEENKYQGEKLSEARVMKWAKARGDMNFFLQMVWEGLSRGQQQLVRRFVLRGKVDESPRVEELVRVGVLRRGGGRVQWCIPWTLPFVREFVGRIKDQKLDIKPDEMKQLGKKERVLLEKLMSGKSRVVSYDELGDAIWGAGAEYSLWALSRLARRVAKKLVELGYGDGIENVRGVGYRILQGSSL